ncbi:MAG: ABC transporter ATP-binding protein [Rubrivivax sp.]
MLEVEGVGKTFGGLKAVDGVSFDVREGEIRGVIGPNGAGKTTLFHLITGILRPNSGSVRLDGRAVEGHSSVHIARCGVARTFQQPQTFRTFTALENVMLGLESTRRSGAWACGLGLPASRSEEARAVEEALIHLEFVGLAGRADRIARELPLGEQRYVEIARALATKPRLLLLDEPAAGLNDSETVGLASLLQRVRDRGVTLLLIEHHMQFVMSLCDRIVVLNFGRKLADGPPEQIRHAPEVISAYLGSAAHA